MIFEKKYKHYIKFATISQPSREGFMSELAKRTFEYQNEGYEVEIQYQLGNTYTALILVYEVK